MPIVSIRMAKGRDIDCKRRLAAEVTRAVAQSLDLPPELVSIQIEEFDRENWATGGELHIDKFGPGFGKP
ncbi:tautomerase family protein [Desulfomicrobium escambiense]|uniref:tautomerase family protein n=1 Tax=Desulfomicrobium escambiense TaxID=29503 RepID=UPI0003F6D581|nr:tautomerase family protein [Desulfomicrobium escambiense]